MSLKVFACKNNDKCCGFNKCSYALDTKEKQKNILINRVETKRKWKGMKSINGELF